eukprot:TRINITY_DN6791_c0_g2_i2.p1 TRINITY_DN6791_c0_g2~~TRINITY_DN6791_c0_g2_i2.p1  ORF type:complete len:213 (-),score=62.00 TRINITY_DN6791_c0_g2_i2:72-710(-)
MCIRDRYMGLWGNDLDDVSVIKELPNLEVLSLSVNKISSLKYFSACPRLTELYLRKNSITDLSEIQHLIPLRQLRVLWLWDNPCAETANYRLIVIRCLPSLVKLDNMEIAEEEKQAAARLAIDLPSGAAKEAAVPGVLGLGPAEDEEERYASKPKEQYVAKRPLMKASAEHSEETRNENILCAVLSLLKELDAKSLELIRRDIDRKLSSKKS